jgi:Domain of unknown function (DUF5753)/Helix-turn-helix domain
MPPSGSPTVRRRRLAAELRRLRGNRTGGEVAKAVGWSTTKISRAESGRESLPPTEIEKLLDCYGIEGRLRTSLLELAEDATRRGWWEEYADALSPEYVEYIGLETEAAAISQWQTDVIPGLLQTEGYVRRLDAAFQTIVPTIPPAAQERFLEVRMRRQERLTSDPPLQLSVILDEAVLLRGVGDRGVMRDQLARLADVAEQPNVHLQVMPLDREVALGGPSSFVILSFGSPEEPVTAALGDVVSTENLTTRLYVEGEADTHLYRLFFQGLAKAALPPAESRKFILEARKRAWS